MKRSGFTVVELLIVVIILGVISVIALPQFTNAQDKARQSQTVSHMKTIASTLLLYNLDQGTYPTNIGIDELAVILEGSNEEVTYIASLPRKDGWGQLFQVSLNEDSFTIWSCGKNNGDSCDLVADPVGQVSKFTEQIILRDGSFLQFPAGAQQ